MATIRSTLPSRLRRLLSGEASLAGPSLKVDSETPLQIKALIDKVIQSPLQDIVIPLSGFRWEYDKGNFHHWRPLFLHFDTYFKTYLSCRKDLLLEDNILGDDSPFPKHAILQILRVMQTILENCPNKSAFPGLEHFRLLLSSTDPEILIASLETLASLVKINPSKLHGTAKLIGCGSVNSCLLSLAQGWGSKEEGLGLYSCVMVNERTQDEGLSLFPSDSENDDQSKYRLGSTLYFELHGATSEKSDVISSLKSQNTTIIQIPDLHTRKEDDLMLMKHCIEHYNVPQDLRFSLLTRIRYAHAFHSSRTFRLHSRICLLAFIVLVQSNDAHDELMSFLANEPEYTNELIRIVRCEETIPGAIRTLAMQALGAQLAAYSSTHERARILSNSSINFAGANRMILLNVLQRAFVSLNTSTDPSSLAFVEAILQFYLLHVISSSNTGGVIRGSGMVPVFLPLLEDTNPSHAHLVSSAVKTLQKLMDYSHTAVSLFKDLGGVEILSSRLQMEVHRVVGSSGADDGSMVIGECSSHSDDLLFSQKRLIRALLKALGSATYTPSNSTRSENTRDGPLPATLSLIFSNVDKFGGEIYSSTVTLMNEIIHKDPTCFSTLHELGLPDAFLASVISGILPSSKALTCVPNGLGAICLNAKGLDAVKETGALRFLVDIFTTKKYVLPMNEAILPLSNAVEELLRHVSPLRSTGVDIIIEIVNRIASFYEGNLAGSSGSTDSSTAMDMDLKEKESEVESPLGGPIDSAAEGISDEQFLQLCTFHVMVLVHKAIENAETCRIFVEKSGIQALLKLLLRPSIFQSSQGMSIVIHSTMVFKSFTQHHSAPLAQSFCSSLRDHLKKAISGFNASSGLFLLDPKATPDVGIFSSLFIVEFLLFLAISKDARWISALLSEFGNGSKDVLVDIGQVQREVLWQIALLEDAKLETKEDASGTATESQQPELSSNENDEQRFNSFRQLIDPLLRRRMSRWSVESQFFELINLYRDLSRASLQQRLGSESPSNIRFGSSSHLHQSDSHAAGVGAADKENDRQKSYYSSCCDMLGSLSSHISHLFQELGKAVLIPTRRRDDTINVSPSSKSVICSFASIAWAHMEFSGHVNPSMSEASVSTKCRYLGKVVDFIDSILLEKSDSCNPVFLNCLYGQGVVESVLTTFQATSQLLFAMHRTPASPMETDDGKLKADDEKEEKDFSWIHGPLTSYGKLMDHLVTSSYILSAHTKHLLEQPLINGDVPFPRDAETFVKVLQSMVLKAVLPVWSHTHFTDCNNDFITSIISIIKHVYSGVEVKNASSNSGGRLAGPPPNETTIASIEEMGFSRARAEEALRQVGANSVELAMEWLFSHPEEPQEDDELARALAMSLGNSGQETKVDSANENRQQLDEEEIVELPPVDELLSTCTKLLQLKDTLAFPVRDLLVMLGSQNDGQYRTNIINFIIGHVRSCSVIVSSDSTLLSSLLHVLALIFHEDVVSREVALKNRFVGLALDLLSKWDSGNFVMEKNQAPKWVTTMFLAIDRLLQVENKLDSGIGELLKKDEDANSRQDSIVIDDEKQNKKSSSGNSQKFIDVDEQKRLIEIACSCITRCLPSETMQAVLQLCATLTRTHLVAISFLDAGGIRLLLSLPTSSLFPGFDNVAATIIRHVLEDPQTLQQAMESEIRQSLVAAANRHSNGRVSPRNFLLNLTSVISRDPVIFMQAAQSVCRVEMVGDRPYVILVKDREKDKCKEKEKDSSLDKEKKPNGDGHGKLSDAGFKNSKVHRKPPQSFINVIELLLDSVVTFVPPVTDGVTNIPVGSPSVTDMDLDVALTKGKGKAVATPTEENEANNQEASAHLAKVVFVLKLLTEILMMYSSAIHVLLRRDAEISSRGTPKVSTACFTGGIFHHVIHKFLPCLRGSKKDKKGDGDWRHKLATRTSQFLVASCVRSTEARRRIFTDISCTFNDFVDSSICSRSPGNDVQAFIDLLNDVLSARTPTGSYISAEASVTFIDAGLVKSLTRTLKVLDLDHPDSSKVVTGLVKALECVTKEHVRVKGLNSTKPAGNSQLQRSDDGMDTTHSMEIASQPNHESITADHNEPYPAVQTYGGSEAVTEDMEHDQDVLEASFAPAAEEDDYMHESSEEARGLENEIDSMGIRIDIQPHVQENIEEDDEDMSGDDGDDGDDVDEDEDEDEEDHNDLEEDEVHHHLPHPDTDQDDHEMDDDEFDEEVLEEDDEDDEDDEDGVILRLDEGINGINVLDHIEVFSTEDDTFPNEALHMMPVEFLGSRRQGRTTSIYNILGRTGVTSTPPRHPLLMEPSSLSGTNRHSEIGRGISSSDRNIENSSQLDTIFRSLRNGRQQGHRLSLWSDDNQQAGGSSTSVVPQGFEELLVSRLRQPDSEKPSEQTEAEPQGKVEANQTEDSEAGARVDTPAESSMEIPPTSSEAVDSLDTAEMRLQTTQETDAPGAGSQTVEMHFEQNDTTIRDAEAVSQESGGSGGTLGESLRSLDVEIGSADGHDDGGERQPSADRVPLGDLHVARPRRTNAASGNSAAAGGRDISLHSVTEVPENPSQEADQAGSAEEQQINGDADSGPIDPAFLDALPEDLRAEVLSAQQSQAAQPASNEQQHTGDIDPEFLAALPPDIRAEVLAQQQTQRSHQSHQSHELEGQPVEMDTVSIIATFPSDIREEVLLTSSDAILANLTPALVAEANMLRERFAHRYHNRTLFGMYPRSRRGESSRRGEVSGSSLDRVGGVLALRNSVGGKVVEADGSPLVDIEALKAMIRLLRVVQPLYKGSLQRLLLNLCAHGETRKTLVEIMMDMLMLDGRKPAYQIDTAEPLYRLYGCQSNVLYSRPQSFDGIPPLVSRRILETLTYLARNHPYVAKILLKLKLPRTTMRNSEDLDSAHGKAPIVVEDDPKEVEFAIALLLSLLNQPLYLRSIAHLEQLLSLLEVVIDNAENKSNSLGKSLTASAEHPPPTQTDAEMSIESGHAPSDGGVASSNIDDALKATSLDTNGESDVQMSLVNLPQAELRLLCSLLGREGLSDNAYTLVAEVLKKLVVMAPTHSLLFVAELADAVQGLTKSAVNEMHMYGEAEMALLNTTSSDGAAILRVLQALSSIVVSLNEKEKDHQMLPDEEHAGALSRVSDTNAALEPLWVELSICISRIESYSDSPIESLSSSVLSKSKASASMPPLPAGSQKILPYIESFFVMCEKLHPEQSKASSDTGITAVDVEDKPTCASPHKPSGSLLKTDEKEKHVAFTKFTERHRKLLNAFIRQNPGLLEKSFSLMLKVPRFIDFDNKRAHFRSKIKHQHNHHHGPLRISVRRAYILEDSYNQLRMRSTDDLKGRLTVHFQGEEGIDAGGLTREWYQLLSRFIFDKGALLFTTVGNDSTFQPNPNSVYQTEHLSYFKFVGRVVGKALFDGQLLDVHFTRSFYKHILEVKVTYHDIEAIDPDYFKNLKWMLENDISDVLDLSFSIDADEEKLILYERTEVTDYELIPNGRNIKVTEENKHQYVDLVAEHRLTTAIRPQINAFLEGFVELIPRDLISIFNDKELELLISGLPDIDLDDMRANTEYSGYSAASPVVQWFWEVVQSFSKEDKARLLQFVTGTSKVPLEGFSALQGISGSQKFQIHKAYGSADHLPSAHTCFNQLDLPEYPSKDRLQERLLFAIHEGSEGFGFG